jgi:hypothetical protein
MEKWNIGVMGFWIPDTPVLHHSIAFEYGG